MKARLYHLATAATTLALLVQVLDAGRKWSWSTSSRGRPAA